MGKLHELLAVEKESKQKSAKLITEARDTFGKRHDHFSGMTKKYEAFNEDGKYEEDSLSESKEMVTTVGAKLDYLLKNLVDSIDIGYQKDLTNRLAKADIVVEGVVIASDVPAVTLLSLEDHLRELRTVMDNIPTLEPGIKWEACPEMGEGIYKTATPDVKIRTKKMAVYKTVAKATDKHPEQVVAENQDVAIGKYSETKFSGRISPAEKSKMMDRLEKLAVAVKKARARANEEVVADGTIAKKMFDFLMAK